MLFLIASEVKILLATYCKGCCRGLNLGGMLAVGLRESESLIQLTGDNV